MREYKINSNDSGKRVDRFLHKVVPKLPKALAYKYIRLKRIKLNGKRCQNDDLLLENDILSLYINDEFFDDNEGKITQKQNEFEKITIQPEIVYEDQNIIIVYKPVGLDVHSGSETFKDNLIDIIKAYLYHKGEFNPSEENTFAPSLCNRIDRNTSGLVVAAKNSASLREMNNYIKEKKIHKEYLCICAGKFPAKRGIETAYHKKGKHNLVNIRKDMAEEYKEIITEYEVLDEKDGLSLAKINLITGRTHQIRAHLAFMGVPILGDGKYGNVRINKKYGIFHQQLCAYSLRFDIEKETFLGYLDGKVFKTPKIPFKYENFSVK